MRTAVLRISTACLLATGLWPFAEGASAAECTTLAIDHANILLAPYVWKQTRAGDAARAEAGMPGAYLKAVFQGSATVGLLVDGTDNVGCPASSMPVIEYSVDEGAFQIVQLKETGKVYTLPLADHLAGTAPHRLELTFRAADLAQKRWQSSVCHLRLAGITLDRGGALLPCKARPRKALAFGDSITEGVGCDGLFTSWQSLGPNNARATWFPVACLALDCEYGQLGSGGQGMTKPIEMPPLPQTWDHYDPTTSRLTGDLLLPEPDYIFCCMGTNDSGKDITADYTGWLTAVRKACPHVRVFCVVPPLGYHESEVRAAVTARNRAGDSRVYAVDTAGVRTGYRVNTGATQFAFDGVHPSTYGHGVLGALIAAEAQQVMTKEEERAP